MACPSYRLRLFLSVDLVGSTSFKSGPGRERGDGKLYPIWVTEIRDFYRQFPEHLESSFNAINHENGAASDFVAYPQVWKTVGDEILFCCRIIDLQHLAVCIAAFLRALKDYGALLESRGIQLDVKGAGWLAAFPGQNEAIEKAVLHSQRVAGDYTDEETENRVDRNPGDFDFLGTEIDSGFRVAQRASADSFAVSVELAWLLAKAAHLQLFTGSFQFQGRSPLKGVIGNRAYPIVLIDTERSSARREVRARERLLLNEPTVDPVVLADFLQSFMDDERIELPRVTLPSGVPLVSDASPTHQLYEKAWTSAVEAAKKQDENFAQSVNEDAAVSQNDIEIAFKPVDLAVAWKGLLDELIKKNNSTK